MSQPIEASEEQTHTSEHAVVAPGKPDISRGLSENFSVREAQELDTSSPDNGTTSILEEGTAVASPVEESHKDGLGPEETSKNASGAVTGDADHSALARDIERRASEHLARRAAEMSLREEETEAEMPVERNLTDKETLPETPPPPIPPRKDSVPPKLAKPIPEQELDEKHPPPPNVETQNDVPEPPQGAIETTGAEIQNIMDQFSEGGMAENEIMSPRMDRQQSILVLPPRSSSLEPQRAYTIPSPHEPARDSTFPVLPQGTANSSSGASVKRVKSDDQESIMSARSGSIFQPPPPESDPDPPLPFDFHRFLEQLRHRTADPVARFLRSFLTEFGKKQWMVHEQVKIISDFLEFITNKMAQCEVWRSVSDAEFDNAREGMEKLVMNRLYSQTFSPAIPAAVSSPRKGARIGRSAADQASPHGPGRRGQHQEDVERDEVIAQRIKIYSWVREEHLDIQPIGEKGKKFLSLAQQELLKINTYRAPRDKVICVLNCCKVIFGYLKNSKSDQSADAFVPLLIYTVLRARPENLVSNVQYIWRFRNQDKLGGEAGYYMSSLMGVVTFVENLDRTTLTITDEEFEKNVEQAVSAIAEKNRAEEYEERSHTTANSGPMQHLSEKSALSRAEVTPRNSTDAERSTPRKNAGRELSEKGTSTTDDDGDTDAVSGLLRTIQKPLNSIGRIFSDDGPSERQGNSLQPATTPLPGSTPRGLSPAPAFDRGIISEARSGRPSNDRQRTQEEAAARQASAEAAQAQRVRAQEHKVVVETLQSMFPNLDREVIEDVVRAQEGNVGRAVDACLAMSG